MTTKYVTLSFVIALAAGGLWFGRMSWRVRHQLVTLHVRNVPLAEVLKKSAPVGLTWYYEAMPNETHATIYHPAALRAFRALFKPETKPASGR